MHLNATGISRSGETVSARRLRPLGSPRELRPVPSYAGSPTAGSPWQHKTLFNFNTFFHYRADAFQCQYSIVGFLEIHVYLSFFIPGAAGCGAPLFRARAAAADGGNWGDAVMRVHARQTSERTLPVCEAVFHSMRGEGLFEVPDHCDQRGHLRLHLVPFVGPDALDEIRLGPLP